jgi:WD40 repeat protein
MYHILSTLLLQAHRNWVLCVSWSPDATMIATGDMNGDIWLWDAATGQPLGQCKGHSKWITSLVGCYIRSQVAGSCSGQ